MWLYILSDQLRITGLVSFYLTNNLILYGLILHQIEVFFAKEIFFFDIYLVFSLENSIPNMILQPYQYDYPNV